MKKPEIATKLARQFGLSQGKAADRLDRAIHQIVAKLRKGNPASLPGLGRFVRRADGTISFEPEGSPSRG